MIDSKYLILLAVTYFTLDYFKIFTLTYAPMHNNK